MFTGTTALKINHDLLCYARAKKSKLFRNSNFEPTVP